MVYINYCTDIIKYAQKSRYKQHRNRGYGPTLNAVRFCTEIEVKIECTVCIYCCTVGTEIEELFMHRNRESLLLVKNLG